MFDTIKQTSFNDCKPLYSKSGKRLKFHFKTSNRKIEQKRRKVLPKKPNFQICFKGGKISGLTPKCLPNHLSEEKKVKKK